jgi:hypothetical protein
LDAICCGIIDEEMGYEMDGSIRGHYCVPILREKWFEGD